MRNTGPPIPTDTQGIHQRNRQDRQNPTYTSRCLESWRTWRTDKETTCTAGATPATGVYLTPPRRLETLMRHSPRTHRQRPQQRTRPPLPRRRERSGLRQQHPARARRSDRHQMVYRTTTTSWSAPTDQHCHRSPLVPALGPGRHQAADLRDGRRLREPKSRDQPSEPTLPQPPLTASDPTTRTRSSASRTRRSPTRRVEQHPKGGTPSRVQSRTPFILHEHTEEQT